MNLIKYQAKNFKHDLLAGLMVGLVTIPQAVAYAILAGLPPQAGLYACLVPAALYAVFASSKHLVVGPVAVAALMVAVTLNVHGETYGYDFAGMSAVLCVQSALFLWGLRVFRLGGITVLLSKPVLQGFVNGAALLIITTQLPCIVGEPSIRSSSLLDGIPNLINSAFHYHPWASMLGIGCIIALVCGPRIARYIGIRASHPMLKTGPLIAVLAGILIVALTDGDLRTVGQLPSGLPMPGLFPVDPQMWLDLAPHSVFIAIVAYVESYSIGCALASRERTRVDSNRELVALGAANFGASLTGAYPVAGSFSRSSINYTSGAVTQLSNLVSACVILITLLWLTPVLAMVPQAVLAAIVITAVWALIDFRDLRDQARFFPHDLITLGVTFFTVLLAGVELGLLAGVCISILLLIHRSSRVHIAILGRLDASEHFRNVARFEVTTSPGAIAVRVDENLFFANVNQIEDDLMSSISGHNNTSHLVLVCSGINFIDTSGLEMLRRINHNLYETGATLSLAEVKGPVMDQLNTVNFSEELHGEVF